MLMSGLFLLIAPELQIPPVLSLLTATSITITWTSPTYPNGILKFYTLTITHILMGSTQSYEYDVNSTSTVIGELLPFTEYGVVVTSTNDVGNVSSESAVITTGEIGNFLLC